jgi:hypothetical protein
MKRLLHILFILFLSIGTNAEKIALIIGIGQYDSQAGWDVINGDNDIPLIREVLVTNGFNKEKIKTLCNEEATCKNIRSELNQLTKVAKTGDTIFVHFSGHGQLITDMNGDETDGFDETWVPYDAPICPSPEYHGERHLVDDELNHYLNAIQNKIGKQGKIIVVSDACHSGTGTRASMEMGIRGTSAKFVIDNYTTEQLRNYGYCQYALSTSKASSEKWIHIGACASQECNRQYKGGASCSTIAVPCGSLTYALYSLRNQFSVLTCDEIQKILVNMLKDKQIVSRPQTPQVESPTYYREKPLL